MSGYMPGKPGHLGAVLAIKFNSRTLQRSGVKSLYKALRHTRSHGMSKPLGRSIVAGLVVLTGRNRGLGFGRETVGGVLRPPQCVTCDVRKCHNVRSERCAARD